ncbi:uncharacterized protein A1O9_07282 [Exophiala aquamarina CBS 119918]|uniref:Uncharacterized protein n=1 Tax=Exophiala aquamarina CBS 119918 TaxID=1182545 RepID=A0A072PBE7_9EURO|nr:uncharacterized protein A1O9_07282 [Exophiala aquamarina CBS 119918]KEF57092.1 hypothetical protein A1O9_07282 [Exophiala aquamarina CBS 119918]
MPCVLAFDKKEVGGGLTFALQALLTRHESYVGDSQREHERLTQYIDDLEQERTILQTKNEKIVEENRELLIQLENANSSIKESDEHVRGLELLLRDCEIEVQRLNFLTRRTEELELQMLDMERDRMALSRKVDDSNEETKSTIMRWKESELKVRQLENEVQKIEWEAKQDKERHEEVIARLERERVLERELGGAEGRLKGAAALQGLKGQASGSNVVSHFVRDILQDNANLQAGIAELRELLQTSNDEVQNLREQILSHQPIDFDIPGRDGVSSRPLSEHLNWPSAMKQVQQEVHVHHHYHAKIAGKKDRIPTVRRSSRKRAIMGPSVLPSPPDSSAPSTPTAGPHRFVSSPILPIALHQPQARRNRWSAQSAATGTSQLSSFPGSPRSYYERSSTIFDRLEAGEDSSRPTSPESAAGHSESIFHHISYKKAVDENENVALGEEDSVADVFDDLEPVQTEPVEERLDQIEEELDSANNHSRDLTPKPSQMLNTPKRIPIISEPRPPDSPGIQASSESLTITPVAPSELLESAEPHHTTESEDSSNAYNFHNVLDIATQPSLRRRGSHDSLVSISGMDIHIAKRPTTSTSQSSSLLKGNRAYFTRSPSATRTYASAQPLATVTEFTALSSTRSFSSKARLPSDSTIPTTATPCKGTSLSIEALSGLAALSSPVQTESSPASGGITRLVGGWVRSKWGITPVKSSGDLRAQAQARPPVPIEPLPFFGGRAPGINQPGSIPGFKATRNAPTTEVQVNMVDAQGLQEILEE